MVMEFQKPRTRFHHFVDVSSTSPRLNGESSGAAEKRRALLEKLNSIDPDQARAEMLNKCKQVKKRTTFCSMLNSPGLRKRKGAEKSFSRDPVFHVCRNIIQGLLMDDQVATIFGKPVTEIWHPESIPGYLDIIDQPMDLGTVQCRLLNGDYSTGGRNPVTDIKAFAEDVRLVFENAMLYNDEFNIYYQLAKATLSQFEQTMMELPDFDSDVEHGDDGEEDSDDDDDEIATARTTGSNKRSRGASAESKGSCSNTDTYSDSTKPKAQKCPPPSSGGRRVRTSSVPLTYDEKKRLGEDICKLPEKNLRELIHLITLREGPARVNSQLEIELDIDSMSTPTLREMEGFVNRVLHSRALESTDDEHDDEEEDLKSSSRSGSRISDITCNGADSDEICDTGNDIDSESVSDLESLDVDVGRG
eukprot:CAMPEP_0184691170 /NCGR_PEP_ID=MMETSP0313-20130426/80_1 /TAXON_ID=2792 /ORGANISM="Porphyridium aerugineum, Strain SAG 1380-2" /LENGTH=417 /DNA_ID=CAMNT_0027148837 /DNA_START=1070 /DNA_END=2323 /DNA_ORIENTATION=+